MSAGKYPILAHGELYIDLITRAPRLIEKETPHEYSYAKQKLIENIDEIFNSMQGSNEIFVDEKILCIRLEPKFEAKSYIPYSIVDWLH